MTIFLAETLREVLGDFDAVLRHALDCHGGLNGWTALAVSSAGATLIPLHQRDVPLPSREQGIGEGTPRVARPAVENKNDRVAPIGAFDRHPLLDAADGHEHLLVDRGWWRSHRRFAKRKHESRRDDEHQPGLGCNEHLKRVLLKT
jgi:hypothetical protein